MISTSAQNSWRAWLQYREDLEGAPSEATTAEFTRHRNHVLEGAQVQPLNAILDALGVVPD